MKIALVQDGLMCRGGGEQVALCFHKAFPDAPIYTLNYKSELTFPEFNVCDIRASWLRYFVKTDDTMKKVFFPFGIMAMQSHNLSEYDVVLMSGTHCAKYVKVSDRALVISYSFTPFRLAWDPNSYSQYLNATGIVKRLFEFVVGKLRAIDYKAAQRPDHFVAMTEETAKRLTSSYNIKNKVSIINPPVNTAKFQVSSSVKPYFLVVSRLEYYKKVDLVIDAFNELGYPLVIVGKGLQADEIKALAKDNITFKSDLNAEQLAELYANCRAFIFPQHEDYGITPLEANASGRPVIAFKAGGVLATQVVSETDVSNSTALFFDNQTPKSLVDAVIHFEEIENQFNPAFIRRHAEQFDEQLFIQRIKQFVTDKYNSRKLTVEVADFTVPS